MGCVMGFVLRGRTNLDKATTLMFLFTEVAVWEINVCGCSVIRKI